MAAAFDGSETGAVVASWRLMVRVLHDWNGHDAWKILRTIHQAVPTERTVLIRAVIRLRSGRRLAVLTVLQRVNGGTAA